MNKWSRSLAGVAAGAVFLVSGCSSTEGDRSGNAQQSDTNQASSSALKQIDPCKILSDQQLAQLVIAPSFGVTV